MADKTETKKTEVATSANPAELVFPLDQYGICSELKKVFIRTVGNLKADEGKLKVLNDTLKVLLKYKDARFKDQGVQLEHDRKRDAEIQKDIIARESANSAGTADAVVPGKEEDGDKE